MALPSKFLEVEKKWYEKVEDKADEWAKALEGKDEDYAKALAAKFDVSESEVKSGKMYKGFKKFIENVDDYKDDFTDGIERARKINKWAKNFYRALTGKTP